MIISIIAILFESLVIGSWAYLWVHKITASGEILSWYSHKVNYILIGDKDRIANPDELRGWKFFLWKYTYCAVCFAGFISIINAIVNLITCYPTINYLCILATPAFSMVWVLLLQNQINND